MTAGPFSFYVPMLRAHSGYLDWIVVNGVGMEIQDLLHPGHRPPADVEDLGLFWKRTLARQGVPLSVHGPEIPPDGTTASGVCPLRVAMDLAQSIGARHFLVHPRLGALDGEGRRAALARWEPAAREAAERDLVLLFENTDEADPEPLRSIKESLCDSTGEESVGLCLDVGHAHNNSRMDEAAWIDAIEEDLRYVHLYNSVRGDAAHRALGDGEIDVDGLLHRLAPLPVKVPLCLEMDVPQILASATWLSNRGHFRLRSPQDEMF